MCIRDRITNEQGLYQPEEKSSEQMETEMAQQREMEKGDDQEH